jgi:hypothetical protein
VLSYFSYMQYYPSLRSEVSHDPYPWRIKDERDTLPFHRQAGESTSVLDRLGGVEEVRRDPSKLIAAPAVATG